MTSLSEESSLGITMGTAIGPAALKERRIVACIGSCMQRLATTAQVPALPLDR